MFYHRLFFRPIRVIIAVFLVVFFVLFWGNVIFQKIIAALLLYFLLNEIFIIFKIDKSYPETPVSDSLINPEQSILFPIRAKLAKNTPVEYLLNRFIKKPEIKFLSEKIGGLVISANEVDFKTLIQKASEIAARVRGKYITDIDLVGAYLLLTENQTHLLQDKNLKEDDLIDIIRWARQRFPLDKKPRLGIHFEGYGAFDFFVYGWDTEIKKYAFDFTESVLSQKFTPVAVGREKEYQDLLAVLIKGRGANALLIGDPGSGRTTVAADLANKNFLRETGGLGRKTIYSLMVDRLLAGTDNAGQLEERLDGVLAEIEHAGNIIILIQNIENIFGAGGMNFDMSGVLYEYLKNNRIQIIGTTTHSAYKTFIETRSSVKDLFEIIQIEEPQEADAVHMVAYDADSLENETGVIITFGAIKSAVFLSASYLPDEHLPGKAVDLLREVVAKARINGQHQITDADVTHFVQEKTKIILDAPTTDEKQILLHLEDQLHKRVIAQDTAVSAVAAALRRLRSGFVNKKRPISVFLFLGPTGVGKTETAKALAKLYFGDENKMIRLDMSEYQTGNEIERLLGGSPEGGHASGSLTEMVHEHPFSLVLLDEFEKSNPKVQDMFLQVFDDGRLTDNSGRTVSFTSTIIIATSNAGSEEIREMVNRGIPNEKIQKDLVENLLQKGIFKPELINRFDAVVVFQSLTESDAQKVAQIILVESLKSLETQEINITPDDRVVQKIVQDAYSKDFGARNIRRYIQSDIEDFISKQILENKIEKGAHLTLTVDQGGGIILR